MVQRFKETGHLVFKSTSALSRGILKQRKGRCTIHINGDLKNTELLFQTVHSVNQLSVYGAVANWCYQFGLTEKENEKKWNRWYLLRPRRLETRMPGGASSFQILEKKVQPTKLCEKSLLPTSCDCWELLQNSTECRRRMVKSYSSVENIRVLDFIRKPKHCQLFPKAPSLDQFRKFTL